MPGSCNRDRQGSTGAMSGIDRELKSALPRVGNRSIPPVQPLEEAELGLPTPSRAGVCRVAPETGPTTGLTDRGVVRS